VKHAQIDSSAKFHWKETTIMRKLTFAIAALTLAVALGSTNAIAQTGISLGASTTSGVTFTPTGMGNLSLADGLFGTAAGQGALSGITGFYSFAGGPVALTLVSSFGTIFADYTASGTLNFEITTGSGGSGTVLLTGTLSLVDLIQGGSTGITNTSLLTSMTITGGTLAGDYSGGTGISQLILNLSGLPFLPSLGGAMATNLTSATLDPLTTPEPSSMLLYGSGLVLFGIMLRRRLLAQS
jgi:PEP-CTERM motif